MRRLAATSVTTRATGAAGRSRHSTIDEENMPHHLFSIPARLNAGKASLWLMDGC